MNQVRETIGGFFGPVTPVSRYTKKKSGGRSLVTLQTSNLPIPCIPITELSKINKTSEVNN